MAKNYDPITAEPKWQQAWEEQGLFQQSETQVIDDPAQAIFLLFAFAYPSGSGLHVGHVESKTALDILARYHRMHGKQVFFPVGWDAFGLPAENYAIKTGVPPAKTTVDAINTFRRQIRRIGISYDWANEIATSHPEYYKWTQWIFLQLFQKGLAYRAGGMVNWCPSCQTVLANEQVVNGECERCGSSVVQKELEQWYFKITQYRDELIAGLDSVDWPAATKQQQLNWIGKSKGLSIDFTHPASKQTLRVWTKFWETVFGVTFVVISPEKFKEFELLKHVAADKKAAVEEYLEAASHKTEEERQIGTKDKSGVDTGLLLVNPVNGEQIALWIADYVLAGVGTGVVMGVPAHDERDFDFAKKFGLPIRQVVSYTDPELDAAVKAGQQPFEGEGALVNSAQFDGLAAWGEGKERMADWMCAQGFAQWQTTYKLRDWLISRQRYWGAPIPVVYDPEGKAHPVKEEHLPWLLPTDVDFKPTGESPLRSSKEFVERTERLYGKGWRPEFDTMDTFVDSSWYFLRYVDSRNPDMLARPEQIKKWLPVDLYMIGPEHIVLHLLYARFFTKFLRDEGLLDFDEPFMKMRHQGMILGPDGRKMSKSKGNVINPDEIIEKFGADTLRVYEMFMGPLESDKPWDVRAVIGVYKFLQRMYRLISLDGAADSGEQAATIQTQRKLHQTIQKVSDDIPKLKFNTAIAALMELTNLWESSVRSGQVLSVSERVSVIKLLAPFAPFMAEELYHQIGETPDATVHQANWPSFDPELAVEDQIKIALQVNGKVRAELEVAASQISDESVMMQLAESDPTIQRYISGKTVARRIYVPGKVINFVLVG